MDSVRQFLSYMNEVDFPYVVLRNWEGLPYSVELGAHSDLDLLVYDFDHFFEIFPESKLEFPRPRVRTKVPIADTYIYCDVRFVGDDYYPEDFERAILESREWNERGFWTPNPLMHKISLAYHAVHHKGEISSEYKRHLGDASLPQLLSALQASSVGWVRPSDPTVGSFNGYWKGATSVVEKKDGWVRKSQTGYSTYNLIKNEYDILSSCNSQRFPKVKMDGNSILVEDCGLELKPDTTPANWQTQLQEILLELSRCGIQHRDIKLDNLMVKDGFIRLIDFGWAKRIGTEDKKLPPSCLGFPNKPSHGFDDKYSMARVARQIEYMTEEVAA